jgi:tRNA(fMet)-specific endonuclease VapC
MKRLYLLDSGIAQDFQAGRGGIRERAIANRKNGHRIGICVPVLGELWSGVECSSSRERNLESLRQALSTLRIWPYTTEAAEEFGRIFAELRRAG